MINLIKEAVTGTLFNRLSCQEFFVLFWDAKLLLIIFQFLNINYYKNILKLHMHAALLSSIERLM